MVVGGGGWWINPLQTLPQGLVLTFDFDFDPDPELDNFVDKLMPKRLYITIAGHLHVCGIVGICN